MEWMPYVMAAGVPTLMASGGLGWLLRRWQHAHARALTARDRALQQASVLQAQLEDVSRRWTTTEQDLNARLLECQEANAAYAEAEQVYESELRAQRGQSIQMRRHSVLLDGISGAGKSTLIERLTNPSVTTTELCSIPATSAARRVEPVPLCWEIVGERRILHTLEFYDMVGESPGQVSNNIKKFCNRQADREAAGKAVALVLWDAVAELNPDPNFGNSAQLNRHRLNAIYETDDAMRAISSFVFFLNKVDAVQEALRAAGRGHEYEDFILTQRQKLKEEVHGRSLSQYPAPELTMGSALDGRGVHDCLGAIMRQLGLTRLQPARQP